MRPLPGMSVVGEYTSRFEADVAAARLLESGLESTVLGDPSYSIAPHHVVERLFQRVVRDELADHAGDVLTDGRAPDHEVDALDALFHHRRFADRPPWIRWATWSLVIAFPGVLALSALVLVVALLVRAFP